MKHNPIQEFRDSPYVLHDKRANTLIGLMSSGFKKAMGTAALRTQGVRKTEIGQLVYVPGEFVEIYGIPQVFMAITRSADINKTPDVRTRAILPEWACKLSVRFVKPTLREASIANLLATAGIISGVGDWRQEKGSGSYGSFRLARADDPDFRRIVKTMGRKEQEHALAHPTPYDSETSEMLAWFETEMPRRGFDLATGTARQQQPQPGPAPLLNGDEVLVPTRRGRKPAAEKPAATGKSLGKVPPKYRNPKNPDEVWTGRGTAPAWAQPYREKGKLDKILIPSIAVNGSGARH
jgi:hypothetical protein